MKKHGKTLTDQAKQCLACHKNKGGKRVGTSKTTIMACEICGKPKTCKRRYEMLLCSSCICVVGMIKKRPEKILPIWERFGPADTPLSKSPAADAAAIVAPASTPEWLTMPISPFSVLLDRMATIHEAKKHDYASNKDCPGNFREARRLTDEYIRACNWIRRNGNHAVKDESLADTLIYLANYSLLALLAHEEEQVEGGRLKAEGEEDHNAKDMSFDQGAADTTGHLSELQESVPICGEEKDGQVEG
jgi:hypothetical protein